MTLLASAVQAAILYGNIISGCRFKGNIDDLAFCCLFIIPISVTFWVQSNCVEFFYFISVASKL